MTTQPKLAPKLGGQVHTFTWNWQNCPYQITYEVNGTGQPLLLLPAFSTVSSRSEMRGLVDGLAHQFQTFALDWLGFGDSDRPALAYQPALYQQLLQDFVTTMFPQPVAVIAAGHAAGYVMHLAKHRPQSWRKIVLIAPTWRGPLPTMGAPQPLAGAVRQIINLPIVGDLLYTLNTQPRFLAWMYRRHVFVDPNLLTPAFIQQKWQGTQGAGARFGPAAFVTGGLDPIPTRAEYLDYFQNLRSPCLVAIGEQTPPKSQAEMDALSTLPGIQLIRLMGSLGMAEESAALLAEPLLDFL